MAAGSAKSLEQLTTEIAGLEERLQACEKLLYRLTEILRTSPHFEQLRDRADATFSYWHGTFPGSPVG